MFFVVGILVISPFRDVPFLLWLCLTLSFISLYSSRPFPFLSSAASLHRPQTADTDTETPRTPKSQRVVRALDVEGDSEDAHLLKWLRWIRAAEYDKATRSMAAEWLVFYHQKVWR
jgi:hypothetical protein